MRYWLICSQLNIINKMFFILSYIFSILVLLRLLWYFSFILNKQPFMFLYIKCMFPFLNATFPSFTHWESHKMWFCFCAFLGCVTHCFVLCIKLHFISHLLLIYSFDMSLLNAENILSSLPGILDTSAQDTLGSQSCSPCKQRETDNKHMHE